MDGLKSDMTPDGGPDEAPIKPVSSLRSQFEGIQASSTPRPHHLPSPSRATFATLNSASTSKSDGTDQVLTGHITAEPAQIATGTPNSVKKAPPPVPKPRRHRTAGASQQTTTASSDGPATSTESRNESNKLSESSFTPLSPPRVRVTSPRSPPPKSIFIPQPNSFNASFNGPLTPAGLRSASPLADPRISPRQERTTTPRGSSAALLALDLPAPTTSPSLKPIPFPHSPTNRSIKPPAVNRTAKPSLPVGSVQSSNAVAAQQGFRQRGHSPFDSPPEIPQGHDTTPPTIPTQSKPKAFGLSRESYFESRPQSRSVSSTSPSPRPSLESRAVSYPIRPPSAQVSDTDERPPALPPRRDTQSTPMGTAFRGEENEKSRARSSSGSSVKGSALNQGFASLTRGAGHRERQRSIHERETLTITQARQPAHRRMDSEPESHTQPAQITSVARRSFETRNPTPPPPPRPQRDVQGAQSQQSSSQMVLRSEAEQYTLQPDEWPDFSQASRRLPFLPDGPRQIMTGSDSRLFSVCGEHICISGVLTRVWDLQTGKLLLSMNHGETVKITALAFKPARRIEGEGKRIWLGTNWGDLLEVDIPSKKIIASNSNAHHRREIVKIHRHTGELWTLDDDGKLFVWPPTDEGAPDLSSGVPNPRLPRGHTTSLVVGNQLWIAIGKEVKVFEPSASPDVNIQVMKQSSGPTPTAEATSCALIPDDPEHVYFGHSDGKISVYAQRDYVCQAVIGVSLAKITSLVGVGRYLWAGFSTGRIIVYDPRTKPWKVKKEWHAHSSVASLVADRSSLWKLARLQVVSLGTDNCIGVWDGLLSADWFDEAMQEQQSKFCTFREVSAAVLTWNAGASKPSELRYEQRNSNFFREVLRPQECPDLLVFGLQELVDLEDKKLTAKSFFKSINKDPYGHEHLSSVYRAWRDALSDFVDETMPRTTPYALLKTANLVGLFTCVFIKQSEQSRVRDVQVAEIKTGMGGLHGNKGALVVRFIWDDSSVCLVNCHLAAGQTQTVNRNNDVSSILDTAPLAPMPPGPQALFVGGGDGSMIMDHEVCILNGDLNYRIDTMPRDTVVGAIQTGQYGKLLDRDQLLLSRRRNPGLRLRAFVELPLTFAPTYKYDVGTDNYDSSEKRRAPAWCDRILYRGGGIVNSNSKSKDGKPAALKSHSSARIRQNDYRRHEVRVSDHRPVSGTFQIHVKRVDVEQRAVVHRACEVKFEELTKKVSTDAKLDYLINTFGLSVSEAEALVG